MADYKNRSVDRVLDILEVMLDSTSTMLLSEIASRVSLDKVTTFRFLKVLETRAYIFQDVHSKRYGVMPNRAFFHSKSELSAITARLARAPVRQFYSDTGVEVSVGTQEGASVFYRRVDSGSASGLTYPQWGVLPAHATALGKTLLASRSDHEVTKLFEYTPLVAYTSRTIKSLPELSQQLVSVRERGYALAEREFVDDMTSIAVPIPISGMDSMLALSIILSADHPKATQIDDLVEALKSTALVIQFVMENAYPVVLPESLAAVRSAPLQRSEVPS